MMVLLESKEEIRYRKYSNTKGYLITTSYMDFDMHYQIFKDPTFDIENLPHISYNNIDKEFEIYVSNNKHISLSDLSRLIDSDKKNSDVFLIAKESILEIKDFFEI